MFTLVGYGSSGEEGDGQRGPEKAPRAAISTLSPVKDCHASQANAVHSGLNTPVTNNNDGEGAVSEAEALQSTLVGPQAPPTEVLAKEDGFSRPLSPYPANRAIIRNLTMPTIPNFDIPPSPPGSPPPAMEQKFEHFQKLKKQGIHFNEKLAGSSALKNPALLQKLMSSAGLDDSEQYATTLPKNLWDPSAFPNWAYKEELAKSQQQISKRKEAEKSRTQRESIDFVPPANLGGSINGDSAESTSKIKGNGASAAERVAAGLDGQSSRSPHTPDERMRGDLERRSGRTAVSQSRPRNESPRRAGSSTKGW